MKGQPLVSIVLPTHNGSKYLDQAVQSCLNQTYTKLEVILVDDASTDSTPQQISGIVNTDSRIRSVRHDCNQGLPGALNSGFALARGELLTWTSDDNLYRSGAVEKMLAFLESNSRFSLVYADYTTIDEAGNELGVVEVGAPEELAWRNPIGACFLYRRHVYEQLGGYATDMFLAEDYEFWIRVCSRFEAAPLHENHYLYRLNGPLTRRRNDVRIVHERVLLRHLQHMSWAGHEARCRGYMTLMDSASARGDHRAMLHHMRDAFNCAPFATARHAIKPFVPRPIQRLYSAIRAFGSRTRSIISAGRQS